MAHLVTLYSRDEPFLKIGEPVMEELEDGTVHTARAADIVFDRGFATVDMDDPRIARMIAHTQRTYPIEILEDPDLVAENTEGSAVCPECGKTLKSPLALKGHLRSHKPTT